MWSRWPQTVVSAPPRSCANTSPPWSGPAQWRTVARFHDLLQAWRSDGPRRSLFSFLAAKFSLNVAVQMRCGISQSLVVSFKARDHQRAFQRSDDEVRHSPGFDPTSNFSGTDAFADHGLDAVLPSFQSLAHVIAKQRISIIGIHCGV